MVFLAYSRDDYRTAEEIEQTLCRHGIELNKDKPEAESNPFWRNALVPQLETAEALLVLWSAQASLSPWLDEEIRGYSGERFWLLSDNTPLPNYANSREVRGGPEKILHKLRKTSFRCKIPKDHTVQSIATWRRHEKVEAGRSFLMNFLKRRQPDRKLRPVTEGHLIQESTGLEFRRIANEIYMSTRSVTLAQYEEFLGDTGFPRNPLIQWSELPAGAPVVSVTWFEAMAYSYWLGGVLPSEVEWMLAATAGRGFPYATATGAINHNLANYGCPFGKGHPLPQQTYPSNPAGYWGLCGNTWDWCIDKWNAHRVIKGGCWMDSAKFCEVKARYRNSPIDRDCAVGFRTRIICAQKTGDLYVAERPDFTELQNLLA